MNNPLSFYLKKRRGDLGLGLRELSRMTEDRIAVTGKKVVPSYISHLENTNADHAENVSMDILFSLGVVLGVDPLKLFAMSRPNIDDKFLDPAQRDSLFKIR